MAKSYLRQSPLAHLHLQGRLPKAKALPEAGVYLAETVHPVQIIVRGQIADPAFLQGFEKTTGLALPVDACRASGEADAIRALWMGPDEWLVVAPPDRTDLVVSLADALRDLHSAVVDVSDSRALLQLRGSCARSVLDKGCPIDLHPRSFEPGHVVTTLLAGCHITLHQTGVDPQSGDPAYDIYVGRSFAEYLWSWLEDASREYGLDRIAAS